MKQMCKKKYPSPVHAVTNFLTLVALLGAEPRLHTTIRQLRLESSIRYERGLWILIIFPRVARRHAPSLIRLNVNNHA